MTIVVQKYGGSSVADLEKLGRVADQIVTTKRAGHDVVVVVSAMGKATEQLLELAKRAAASPGASIDSAEPPRRELDMLVSTGERVSMALLSIALGARGCNAISFTGSQSGILTNDRHFDARIIEIRPHRIEDELSRGRVVIVAGYQGMSYRREITTLGRGGSDTTAVALAAGLGAERCEIYSDVDGVYTADPRSVPAASHLPEVSYEMLSEMAESGAKVLNAQAVEWAARNNVRILARKTGDVGENGTPARETVVSGAPSARARRTRAVVAQRNVALIRARSVSAPELLALTRTAGLSLADFTLAGTNLIASLPLTNVPDWRAARAALAAGGIEGLVVGDGLARVSVVGVEVGVDADNVARALATLPTMSLWAASSPLRITSVVAAEALEECERTWHRELVEPADAQSSSSRAAR